MYTAMNFVNSILVMNQHNGNAIMVIVLIKVTCAMVQSTMDMMLAMEQIVKISLMKV